MLSPLCASPYPRRPFVPLPSPLPPPQPSDVSHWLLTILSWTPIPPPASLLHFNLKSYTFKSRAGGGGGAVAHSSESQPRRRGAGLPDLAPRKR